MSDENYDLRHTLVYVIVIVVMFLVAMFLFHDPKNAPDATYYPMGGGR